MEEEESSVVGEFKVCNPSLRNRNSYIMFNPNKVEIFLYKIWRPKVLFFTLKSTISKLFPSYLNTYVMGIRPI